MDASQIQRSIYRQMTPAERWAQAMRLLRQARRLTEAGVRRRHPDSPDSQVQALVARLFLYGHE
jgi:hypothetical protein